MRIASDYRTVSERLVEHVDRASLDGRTVLLDGGSHGFAEQSQWRLVFGILCDLAIMQGWDPKDLWPLVKFDPQRVFNKAGEEVFVLQDTGWRSQAIRWLLSGHADKLSTIIM
jgi:hypothetical protein